MINICLQNLIELSICCQLTPRQIHHGDAVSIFVSKHVSVSLLFVNKQSVSWSFVCQFKTDMLFAPLQDDTEQFVKFRHYTLGPHVTR